MRQRTAIGVAQNDPARTALIGRARNGKRKIAIALISVEEVLAIDERLAPVINDCLHRLRQRIQAFFVGNAERHAHVIVPRLGDKANGLGA